MLGTIPEVYIGMTEDLDKDLRYWSYLLFKNLNGGPDSFDLIRIDNIQVAMEVLGREIPRLMCLGILAKWEPDGYMTPDEYKACLTDPNR